MSKLAKSIQGLRTVVSDTPGDNLRKFDLLQMRSTLVKVLNCFEELTIHHERTIAVNALQELDELEAELLTDESEAQREAESLVKALADGERQPVSKIRAKLANASRSQQWLRKNLLRAKKRKADIATLADVDGVKAKLEELKAGVAAAESAVVAAEKRHAAEMQKLLADQVTAKAAYSEVCMPHQHAVSEARNFLVETASDDVREQLDKLGSVSWRLGNQLPPLRDLHGQLSFRRDRLRQLASANDAKAVAELPAVETRFSEVDAELAEVSAAFATASTKRDLYEAGQFYNWRNMRFED